MTTRNESDGATLVSLRLAQALLDLLVATAPELCAVDDVHNDAQDPLPVEADSAGGVELVDTTLVFDYLLHEELVFERQIREGGYVIDAGVRNGLVAGADEHLNVSCFIGAIIDQEDGRGICIEFNPPFIDRLVGGNAQRPPADLVRVLTYLVRVSGKTVGVLGDPLRVSGDPVGYFRLCIRRLREAIGTMRLQQGQHTGDAAQSANPADDHIRDIPSIHETNATNTATTTHTTALASKEGESK